MRTRFRTICMRLLLASIAVAALSCATERGAPAGAGPTDRATWRDTLFAWREEIDYGRPELYLAAGPLTGLSEENRGRLLGALPAAARDDRGWETVRGVYAFMSERSNFAPSAAGGALIAKRSADRMFAERTLTGCHDWGIVLAASLRALGIPALLVDAASVPWARAYASGERGSGFEGHVFVEAWIEGRWVLLDSTKPAALLDYDPSQALNGFPVGKSDRYLAMFKGLDPIEYGIRGNEDMKAAMASAARSVVALAEAAPAPRAPRPLPAPPSGAARTGGSLIVAGDRAPAEAFAARFRAGYEPVRLRSFERYSKEEVLAAGTFVGLLDLSRPELPAYFGEIFPVLAGRATPTGLYRFMEAGRLRILLVGRDEAELLASLRGLEPTLLERR